MVKTTLYLTPELKTKLERTAAERGQSEAAVIRTALEEFTDARSPRPTFPLGQATGRASTDSERVDEILAEILEADLTHEPGRG
jgi:hypothetical protein